MTGHYPVHLRIRVSTTENRRLGPLPMEVRSAQDAMLAGCITDNAGRFAGALHITALKAGKRPCSVVLGASALQGADRAILARVPRTAMDIEVLPLGVHLQLESSQGLNAKWLTDSVASVLTQSCALAVLRSEEPTPFSLLVTVHCTISPPNEYGIAFAYCLLSMTAKRNDTQIAIVTTEEVKGAGTSEDQALRKAATALLDSLPGSTVLREMSDSLPANAVQGDTLYATLRVRNRWTSQPR